MKKFWFGGDYNPEQWDRETLLKDMKHFKNAGINLITLPVFGWAKLEPQEGVYDFQWLDDILAVIEENGFNVCLATTTAAQPAWLSKKYPEVLPVDRGGRKRTHGMRMFYCVNSPIFRKKAANIAEQISLRYKDYPALVAWHVANEYGTFCYCPTCEEKFRTWLKNRYGTTENLNKRWGTAFWGRQVYDFSEVMLPTELNDDYRFNPVIQLDYMRFVTDSSLECFRNEADVIRKITPNIPVFSNISGFIKNLDQYKLNEVMDVVGWDNYPAPDAPMSLPALKHDIMRSLKNGAPFWIAEQSPAQQNWQPYNKLKKPGEVRRIAYQGIAHGGEACLYFQLRQSKVGQEKFHGAFISHSGDDNTRTYRECASLGKELEKVGDRLLDGKTQSKVGMIFDWENWWALELTSGPTKDMDYLMQVHHYYKPFFHANIAVDMLRVSHDFSGYSIIVAPLLYMTRAGVAEKLADYVKNGGTLIGTYMTGLVDENDQCCFGAYPGKLREVFGLSVEETDALYPEENNEIILTEQGFLAKKRYTSSFLCDVINTTTAKTVGTYGGDFYGGTPSVTENSFGKGKAFYIGTCPEDDFLKDFVGRILEEHNISPPFTATPNVEIAKRLTKDGELVFVINHGEEKGTISFGSRKYENILSHEIVMGSQTIDAEDVFILKAVED